MELFLALLLASSLVFEVKSTTIENRLNFVRDANGKQHVVNRNPYTVIDAHLEPRFTAESDTVFRLYTRKNPEQEQLLKPNDTRSITSSNFNPLNPTRFLVHGWNQDRQSDILVKVRNSYLSVGAFNVISVDWGKGASTINYITARYLVEPVGSVTSQMIDTLVQTSEVPLDSINVIGHSLGAHIAGVVGKRQNGRLNTIVGLDPAGPLFSSGNSDILKREDAQYVETVGTNVGLLGISTPLGTANFYPNGGMIQPGCGFDLFGACAHARSWQYFAESISGSLGLMVLHPFAVL